MKQKISRGFGDDVPGARVLTTTSLGNHAWLRSSGCWKCMRT